MEATTPQNVINKRDSNNLLKITFTVNVMFWNSPLSLKSWGYDIPVYRRSVFMCKSILNRFDYKSENLERSKGNNNTYSLTICRRDE